MSKMSDKRSGKPPIAPASEVSSALPATLNRQAAQAAINPRRQAFQKILNEAQAAHPQIAAARRRRQT
jgi:hypothetical protein